MLKPTGMSGCATSSFGCLGLKQSPHLPGGSSSFLLDKSYLDHKAPRIEEDEEAEEEEEECSRRASKSCIPAATILQSWVVSLVLRRGCGRKKHGNLGDSNKLLLWRIVLQRLVNEVHCRRKKVVQVIRMGSKKQIDFSYDESSYAKNFDMGHENWVKNDPCFRIQELSTSTTGKMNKSSR